MPSPSKSKSSGSSDSPRKSFSHVPHRRVSVDGVLKLHHVPAYFLILCLLIAIYFLFQLLQPFATVLLFAAVLSTAFYPLYKALLRFLRYESLSSVIATFLVLILIVVPFVVLIFLLASEGLSLYTFIQSKIASGVLDTYVKWAPGGMLFDWYQRIDPSLHINMADIAGQISSLAQKISAFLLSQAQGFATGIFGFLFGFLIMSIMMFFFFKDGPVILNRIMALSPLPNFYERRLLSRLRLLMSATLYGTFLTAIIQGIAAGIGYAIAGIDQVVFWGVVTAFFALLPYFGTGLVWVPASLYLLCTGHIGSGIFLIAWGLIFVGTIDNFLRSYFISRDVETYPLLTFLCIMGGIIVWGFTGIILGPLVLTLFLALIEIYEKEYRPMLKDLDHHGL